MCNSTNDIYEIQIEGSWLKNGTTLPLFLAQSPLSSDTEIKNCQTNGNVRRFLDSLLSGGANSHIAKMALSSDGKAVVLLPEFSLSKDYWQDMDNLIFQFSGPLIIIAGIGYWTESEIRHWKNASENREFGFATPHNFGSPNRTYNCGCCWIRKENGDMRRIVFVKNFLEQRSEVLLTPSLVPGDYLLCLRFEDIDIYPLICADVTCNSTGQKPLDKVLNNIREKNNGKKQLIVTIAHEKNPAHDFWQRGIAYAIRKQRNPEVAAIMAIANTASCSDSYKCADDWRNLTGLYVTTDLLRKQAEYPAACCLAGDREILGVLARTGEAAIFAGEVSWDFGGGGHRDLWHPRLRALADENGTLMPPEEGNLYRDELLHCLYAHRREFLSASIADKNKKTALEEIIPAVKNMTHSMAKHLHQSALFGPNHATEKRGTKNKQNEKAKIQQASKALGALKKVTELEWQIDNNLDGQLKHAEANILVWASPTKTNRAIQRDLEIWELKATPHDPLLVFADGTGGTFNQSGDLLEVKPDRRTDISSSPSSPTEKDYTCNKIVRVAHLENLRRFDDCYEEQNFEHSINALLNENVTKIRGS